MVVHFFPYAPSQTEPALIQTGSPVSQAGLERLILLLLPPKCWDFRHVPPHLVHTVLGIEPRTSCMLSKHCTIGTIPLASLLFNLFVSQTEILRKAKRCKSMNRNKAENELKKIKMSKVLEIIIKQHSYLDNVNGTIPHSPGQL